ncbi:MAG: ribonuclease H-like domain-containing protein [Planctomycetota bacterium]
MTEFSDKLRRRFKVNEAASEPASPLQDRLGPSPAAEFLRRRLLRRAPPKTKVALPVGEDLENAGGRCFVRRLRYPLAIAHGDHLLASARTLDRERLAILAKDPTAAHLEVDRCLFLDTETTGLSGGAGTIVFLCGVAWFDGDDLVLEQIFLRAFAEEEAALLRVAEHVAARPHLVTFVGKSFDRHRLASRMAMHRIVTDIVRMPHLDLYHLARRVWRDRLPDTRLRTVEQSILGVHRSDDLPGAEAPAAWLSWIDDATGPVDRVFEHNRLDVLSLVTLLGALARA